MLSRIIVYCSMILLLAAHFSRGGQNLLAFFSLLLPFLLLIKGRWVIQTLQAMAYLAAAVWILSAYRYLQTRLANGDDWVRLLLILGAVALYSAWSGYFLRSAQMDARYGFSEKEESA